ncbi:protein MULTIPLE CHLOROPLAST DIVISION SITE 1 isoform X1 [Citrus sinensis]|uniref:protein MULTIPLE CHLOROPLAST DIVISION SITE 1 isoform X1 n=1 Tax=Citrus sinensis TaxID=2711 RepID=UPI002278B8D2|nr:protein MULTIPLE CHLOROPLAST DIVISION SITE 1 isoform X1 [Citrus sinensis]
MASIWTLQFHSLYFPHRVSSTVAKLRTEFTLSQGRLSLNRWSTNRKFQLKAVRDSASSNEDQNLESGKVAVAADTKTKDPVAKFQETLISLPPVAFVMKRHTRSSFAIGLSLSTAFLVIVVRAFIVRRSRYNRPGSVEDLVRRGQLRSDRRDVKHLVTKSAHKCGYLLKSPIYSSRPLKYEDPFNNPLVKVGKSNSTMEMCGKVYRLAPITLTKEQQTIHQKRRSRAYQWKRPTIFLKEGDLIPPDVDPDTVRWIPANHPFATTANDIDEDLAQNNVYQKHGVPFRIRAEHEALQKKLEALQNEQKLNKLVIDSSNAKDFERAFKLNPKSEEPLDQNPFVNQSGDLRPPRPDQAPNGYDSNSSSEEMQKP